MSLRLHMLQAARRAPAMLGEARGAVQDFLWAQLNPDGGFKDRAGQSDLYYTVFGIEALLALECDPPLSSLYRFVSPLGYGDHLDFIHLTCLARAWSLLPPDKFPQPPALTENLKARILYQRRPDGGFAANPKAQTSSLYGTFLACGALQDLQIPLPNPQPLIESILRLKLPSPPSHPTGFANDLIVPLATTPTTAAACALLYELEYPLPLDTHAWLLAQADPHGGFRATSKTPMPDLLSTAVALHALSLFPTSVPPPSPPISDTHRERTLDFLDSLWSSQGAFHGNWTDDTLDCEYLFYALLALGHLSN